VVLPTPPFWFVTATTRALTRKPMRILGLQLFGQLR
jgi:hypothetical protein